MDATSLTLVLGALGTFLAGLAKIYMDLRATRAAAEKSLVLSDGRMTAALQSAARLARRLAEITREPGDIFAAEEAEREVARRQSLESVAAHSLPGDNAIPAPEPPPPVVPPITPAEAIRRSLNLKK